MSNLKRDEEKLSKRMSSFSLAKPGSDRSAKGKSTCEKLEAVHVGSSAGTRRNGTEMVASLSSTALGYDELDTRTRTGTVSALQTLELGELFRELQMRERMLNRWLQKVLIRQIELCFPVDGNGHGPRSSAVTYELDVETLARRSDWASAYAATAVGVGGEAEFRATAAECFAAAKSLVQPSAKATSITQKLELVSGADSTLTWKQSDRKTNVGGDGAAAMSELDDESFVQLLSTRLKSTEGNTAAAASETTGATAASAGRTERQKGRRCASTSSSRLSRVDTTRIPSRVRLEASRSCGRKSTTSND